VKYENRQVTDPDQWFKVDKPAYLQNSPFVNLPYLKDGDRVIG
jgi:hypothetical protein